MPSTRALFAAILFVLLAWPGALTIARDDDDSADDETDEYDVTARVLRVGLLEGDVSLQRADAGDWEKAALNLPLLEGDTVATARDARLEIQIDARNYIRLGGDSVLRIITLRDAGIALSLAQGTATLRLVRFDRAREYFEIDAPKTTFSAERPGLYRVDATPGGTVRLTVRDGGQARIYSETSGFTLREGRSAELIVSGAEADDWQLMPAAPEDDWDRWIREREHYLAAHLRFEQRERYYDADIWGAEELDEYGDWAYAPEYGGWVWCPNATALNNYPNWAPNRYGQWRWRPPYGWTWVADEPWGWAPYHYGRWVYYNGGWCWAPRGYGYNQRIVWRPSLVVIVKVAASYGEQVAWYPLTYGQHDPYRRNRHHRYDDRPGHPSRPHEGDRGRHPNPPPRTPPPGAVTCLPEREFGNHRARPRPATTDIARRAREGEPESTRPPRAPAEGAQDNAGDRNLDRRARGWPAGRPSQANPPGSWRERPTGAARRQPGEPLDDELRRSRLYNGRTPRTISSPAEAGASPSERSTGAVERPTQPRTRHSPDQNGDTDRHSRNNGNLRERPDRPGRSQPADAPFERPPNSAGENGSPRERAVTPPVSAPATETPQPETTGPAEQQQPHPQASPEPVERAPARHERSAPVERDLPMERPSPRHERPERRPETQPAPAESLPPQPEAQPIQPEPTRVEPARPEPPTEAPRVEPARPEPPTEAPAPPREEPPAPREEPARRDDPPAPTPPPPSAPEPPPPSSSGSSSSSEPSSPPPSPPSPPPAPAPDPPAPAPTPAPEPPRSEPQPAPREQSPPTLMA